MATGSPADDLAGDIETLKRDMHQLKADLASIARDMKAVGSATGKVTTARAEELGQRAWKRAAATEADLRQELTEHPLSGILAAFGVGFVIGKLLDSRR